MNQFKTEHFVFVGKNCAKATADIAALSTGAKEVATLNEGEVVILNEKGLAVTSQAIANESKEFNVFQVVEKKLVGPINIKKNEIKAIFGTKPQQYLGKRTIIGNFAPNSTNAVIVPQASYAIHLKLKAGSNPSSIQDEFVGLATAGVSGSTTLQADLYTDLAKSLYSQFKKTGIRDFFRIATHTDQAAGTATALTATYGSSSVVYTTAMAKGAFLRHQATNGDGRLQPNTVYKVVAIDTVNKIATLNQPWVGASGAGLVASIIVPNDTNAWAFYIESLLVDYRDGEFTTLLNTDYEMYQGINSGFEEEYISIGEGINAKQSVQGDGREVRFEQAKNWIKLDLDVWYKDAIADRMYSGINIFISGQATTAKEVAPRESNIRFFLERGTLAQLIAGTLPALGTNILTGTGVETSAANSLVNAINFIGVAAGVLKTALNTTKPNAGGSLAKDVDY